MSSTLHVRHCLVNTSRFERKEISLAAHAQQQYPVSSNASPRWARSSCTAGSGLSWRLALVISTDQNHDVGHTGFSNCQQASVQSDRYDGISVIFKHWDCAQDSKSIYNANTEACSALCIHILSTGLVLLESEQLRDQGSLQRGTRSCRQVVHRHYDVISFFILSNL